MVKKVELFFTGNLISRICQCIFASILVSRTSLRVRWNKNTSKNSLGRWGESKSQWKKVLLYHHISNSTSWLSFFIGILWKTPRNEFKILILIWIQIWFFLKKCIMVSTVWCKNWKWRNMVVFALHSVKCIQHYWKHYRMSSAWQHLLHIQHHWEPWSPASLAASTARSASLAASTAHVHRHWQHLLHIQHHWEPLQRHWQHLLHVQHHWQHLLHVQRHFSFYCVSSVIGSIYCTSSVILASTASPVSLGASLASLKAPSVSMGAPTAFQVSLCTVLLMQNCCEIVFFSLVK